MIAANIYLNSVQVVNSEHCRSLILVTNEAEAFLFAGLLVADQIYVDDFTVLGEDTNDVTFAEIVRKSTDEDPR